MEVRKRYPKLSLMTKQFKEIHKITYHPDRSKGALQSLCGNIWKPDIHTILNYTISLDCSSAVRAGIEVTSSVRLDFSSKGPTGLSEDNFSLSSKFDEVIPDGG